MKLRNKHENAANFELWLIFVNLWHDITNDSCYHLSSEEKVFLYINYWFYDSDLTSLQ